MKNIMQNDFFEFDNSPCYCNIETKFTSPNTPPEYIFKVFKNTDAEVLHYAYSPNKGLNICGKAGAVISENVLGQLLALNSSDINGFISFFESFGFLFPLKDDAFLSISFSDIQKIFDRLKAVILLMSAISGKMDYKRILELTTYLLYSEPIETKSEDFEYSSPSYYFTKAIKQYSIMPDINQTNISNGYITIADTAINKTNRIPLEDLQSMKMGHGIEGLIGSRDDSFKHLFALYTNHLDTDCFTRLVADFYYHYQREVGIISDTGFNNISYYDSSVKTHIPQNLEHSLNRIAKQVISKEVNSNISNVFPAFDIDSLSHSWRITSFLAALYFSIFYMKPNAELYKECENPNCKHQKYFLISTTATNKKYCCTACANAAAQRRSRLRKLNQKTKMFL